MPPQDANEAIEHSEGVAPAGKEPAKDGLDFQKLATMHQALPVSTHAERQRFLADKDGDTDAAIDKLRKYLEWREENHDPTLAHLDSWTYATQLTVRKENEGKGKDIDFVEEAAKIPHVIYVHEHMVTEKGENGEDVVVKRKVYQLLLGRLDIDVAEPTTYAHILALYIDHLLDRDSTERYSIVADLRAGHGWANIPAVKHFSQIPFLQSQARILQDLFPSRINCIIIFPIPSVFTHMWDLIVPFLSQDVMGRVHLVSGWDSGKDASVPEGLRKHLDEGVIAEMERTRESNFVR